MMTKAEIQKEIDTLQREAEQLTKRRAALITEREALSASVLEQSAAIGAAVIAERDITKDSDALNRDRAKLEATKAAIEQINRRLQERQIQATQMREAFARVDFDRLTNEADELFLAAVDQYRAALAALRALAAKFGELQQMGQTAGTSADNDDHLRLMAGIQRNMLQSIERELFIVDGDVCTRVAAEARLKRQPA